MKAFRCVCIIMISAITLMSCSSNSIEESHASSSGVIEMTDSESSQHSASPTEEMAAEEKETEPEPIPELPKVDLAQYYYDDSGEPLFPAQDEETELFGYINSKGEWVIEPQFYFVGLFQGGLAGVAIRSVPNNRGGEPRYNSHALINRQGQVVFELPENYYFVSGFKVYDQIIPVFLYYDRWPIDDSISMEGFMNLSGQWAIPPIDANFGLFREGLVFVTNSNGKCGYMNKKGDLVIELPEKNRWVTVIDSFSEGLAGYYQGDKLGYIDQTGNWAIEPKFESVLLFSGGVAAAKQYGYWGLIDYSGNWVLQPTYDAIVTEAWGSMEGLYNAKLNGMWGCIDITGKWIIEPNFENSLQFSEGVAAATLDPQDESYVRGPQFRRYGYIDMKGNWVIEPKYLSQNNFSNGLVYVVKSDSYPIDMKKYDNEEYMFETGYIDIHEEWIYKTVKTQ